MVRAIKTIKRGGQDYKLMKRNHQNTTGIPDFELDSLARAILPVIQNLFEDEAVKKEFEECQAQRKAKQLNSQTKDIEKKSR